MGSGALSFSYHTWGNSWLAAWSNSWGGGSPIIPVQTHGGIDHKKYREYLERLTRATSLDKNIPEAIEAAEELHDLALEIPEIEKLTSGPVLKGTLSLAPQIDYAALQRDIELIRAFLDLQQFNMEQDDEMAFLMMMQ